jgi:hypothetical protein
MAMFDVAGLQLDRLGFQDIYSQQKSNLLMLMVGLLRNELPFICKFNFYFYICSR